MGIIHSGRMVRLLICMQIKIQDFAGGAQAPCVGVTIYKTIDDTNFEPRRTTVVVYKVCKDWEVICILCVQHTPQRFVLI